MRLDPRVQPQLFALVDKLLVVVVSLYGVFAEILLPQVNLLVEQRLEDCPHRSAQVYRVVAISCHCQSWMCSAFLLIVSLGKLGSSIPVPLKTVRSVLFCLKDPNDREGIKARAIR